MKEQTGKQRKRKKEQTLKQRKRMKEQTDGETVSETGQDKFLKTHFPSSLLMLWGKCIFHEAKKWIFFFENYKECPFHIKDNVEKILAKNALKFTK
jgi:hypothetical protein